MSGRLLNLSLRMVSLGSRFLLAILLAKSMQKDDFGYYGLLAAAVTYLVYLVGIDFYTYSMRDLVTRPTSDWRGLLRDQCLLYVATFSLVGAVSSLLWAGGAIGVGTLFWLLMLLASEHLSQELYRLLIIAGKVPQSSIAIFIRSGLWVLILVALWWQNPTAPVQLQQVFILWFGGGILSIVWSLWCLRVVLCDRTSAGTPINWLRLRGGIRIAALFLAGTLVLRLGSMADRFLVERFAGLAAVGPYVLYAGLAGAIATLVDATVVVYDYPGLTRAWQSGEEQQFRTLYRAFLRRVFQYALGVALMLALLIRPVLEFIGKQQMLDAWPLAAPLILANILQSLANVPHYGLYAAGQDGDILKATVAGTAVFLLVATVAGPLLGTLGVAWSLCLGALVVFLSKAAQWRRVIRKKVWVNGHRQFKSASPASNRENLN